MNSLDDFARLRPDLEPATSDDLDAIWSTVTESAVTDSVATGAPSDELAGNRSSRGSAAARAGRRRLAVVGAAASLVVGVVAIAALSERAEAPPAVSQTVPDDGESGPSTVAHSVVDPFVPVDVDFDAGEPPLWGVAEAGWTLVEFEDRAEGPIDSFRLFAGPDGLATSWVGVVSSMSDPYLPAPDGRDDGIDGNEAISVQRFATEELGSVALLAGGVSKSVAMDVFRSVEAGGEPTNGFVESSPASAAVRTIRYRFVDEAGQFIDVDVQGAGVPRFEVERDAATATESWDATPGVDAASIAYAGEYTLLLRNGFWVTRIVTSAPPDSPTTFTRLAELVQLTPRDEWEAARTTAQVTPG